MKHKKEAKIALLCFSAILLFIVGMRCGLHDGQALEAEERAAIIAEIKAGYKKQLSALESELEAERQVDHVEIEYVYTPLPVDYDTAPEQPEEDDIVLLAKMLYMEAGVSNTFSQIAACADCALFRVEAGYGTLRQVITAPGQFVGYSANYPVDARMYNIAKDTMLRHELAAWERDTFGFTLVSTTIPGDFMWFTGDGCKNTFTNNNGGRITP